MFFSEIGFSTCSALFPELLAPLLLRYSSNNNHPSAWPWLFLPQPPSWLFIYRMTYNTWTYGNSDVNVQSTQPGCDNAS